MKICPTCKTSYEDDSLAKCPKDGADLLETTVSENPPLPEVVPASPDAITSDFDVPAVKKEQEKQVARASEQKAAPSNPIVEEKPLPNAQKPSRKQIPIKWIIISTASLLILGCFLGLYFWYRSNSLSEVNLHSVPPGAQVTLDGQKIGITPIVVHVKKGLHQVQFEQAGFQTIQETIEITQSGRAVVKKMIPIATPNP